MTTARRYVSFEQVILKHLQRRLPSGSTAVRLRLKKINHYAFKQALRCELIYQNRRGTTEQRIYHLNIPSIDTQHETTVASLIERALARSQAFTGALAVPKSLGTIRSLQAHVYEDVPGVSLPSLFKQQPDLAILSVRRTADWLERLSALKLNLGPRRTTDRIQLETTFFIENIERISPQHVDHASRVLDASIRAQSMMTGQYASFFRTTHGDLNLDNIIVGPGHVALIDFGNSMVFDPFGDVGNFMAQVDVLRWRGLVSTQLAKRLQATMVSRASRWPGLGPQARQRIELHRAWWVMQVVAYYCSVNPSIGKKILDHGLALAESLLTKNGFPVVPSLELVQTKDFRKTLVDASSMLGYFREHLREFFPNAGSLTLVEPHAQHALSTSSFLLRYALTGKNRHGKNTRLIVRGNYIRPDTYRFLEHVYAHARGFSTMRPLTYDRRRGYLFYEELAGTPFREISLHDPKFSTMMFDIGKALGRFHAVPISRQRRLSLGDDRKLVAHMVRHIVRFGHGCLPHVRSLAAQLLRQERRIWKQRQSLVHNDFQASNILKTKTGIGLIDFTMSGVAHPAIDVANFVSHLHVMLHRKRSLSDILMFETAFLRGYASTQPAAKQFAFLRSMHIFQFRSTLDILATTVVNLGPQDPHRATYVRLLTERLELLKSSLT